MTWYNLEEKVPNRGDRIILVSEKGRVCPNFTYEYEFANSDEELKKIIWDSEKLMYSRWGYMDDFLKSVYEK